MSTQPQESIFGRIFSKMTNNPGLSLMSLLCIVLIILGSIAIGLAKKHANKLKSKNNRTQDEEDLLKLLDESIVGVGATIMTIAGVILIIVLFKIYSDKQMDKEKERAISEYRTASDQQSRYSQLSRELEDLKKYRELEELKKSTQK